MTKVKLFIISPLAILFCLVLYFILDKSYLFNGVIVGDVCISQKYFQSNYDLVNCENETMLVENVRAWIVEGEYIYGANKEDSYFIVEIYSERTDYFKSIIEIDQFLLDLGLQSYDLNSEENISHIKGVDGVERKY
ncbi:hypothetical protein [Pseudoalteromonas luteoviolacea]|uniref:Uncharacterized protein n=1 Tax=Pseudoalteromonas luteoviolacea DSM 6061 TaxID=1365250 RepID=A0A167ANT0_9GAMM|nr:hypothetical protein [Pseudoalteromonas luteoviolacea]KZN45621.1 hypothetical protein N475_25805 [Pseudoalteromonas luteoviolacea DSM 6061]